MRTLSLNRKTAWQIATIASSDDLAPIATNAPGRQGFERFLECATAAGAPASAAASAARAYDRFEDLIRDRAGSRVELEKVVIAASTGNETELGFRKLAARGQSYTLGVQADTQLAICIMSPSTTNPDMIDAVMVRGFTGFEFLRPNVQWMLGTSSAIVGYDRDDPDRPVGVVPIAPVFDPVIDEHGNALPLAADFCTRPLPRVEVQRRDRAAVYFFEPHEIGLDGRTDCFMATIARNSSKRFAEVRSDSLTYTQHSLPSWISTPVHAFCFDLVVPTGLWDNLRPRLEAAHQYNTGFWESLIGLEEFDRPHLRLELAERCERVAAADRVDPPPGVPRYHDLTGAIFDRLGWAKRDYTVYRLIIRYPPSPIVARLMFHRRPRADHHARDD